MGEPFLLLWKKNENLLVLFSLFICSRKLGTFYQSIVSIGRFCANWCLSKNIFHGHLNQTSFLAQQKKSLFPLKSKPKYGTIFLRSLETINMHPNITYFFGSDVEQTEICEIRCEISSTRPKINLKKKLVKN